MTKRKKVPQNIETKVLTMSARRCCLCHGLNADFQEKPGQIAHLDGDPSNYKLENLAWFCQPHHEQYDTRTRQCKGITIAEAKEYRTRLYSAVDQLREDVLLPDWNFGLDVPLLEFDGEIPPLDSIPPKGIRFADKGLTGSGGYSMLCLSVYFKTSRYFGTGIPSSNERWLFIRADMRPALTVGIQVCALNQRDVDELMGILTDHQGKYFPDWLRGAGDELVKQFLQREGRGWDLHGPRPDHKEHWAGDYFRVWRENEVKRLVVSTFTPTNAGISVNACLSSDAAKAFADYLEGVGFANSFK